jgi:hypothetical protein
MKEAKIGFKRKEKKRKEKKRREKKRIKIPEGL